MDSQSKLRLILTARTRVHRSWYLAVILITAILVTQYPGDYPLLDRIVLGLAGSLIFLVSITVVQLLADIIAILMGVPVRNATLFIFGGVAQVPEDSTRPGIEVSRALVTFLLNLIMAGIFNWLYLRQSTTSASPPVILLQWLAFFWYMVFLFHILPVFPLVGGQILAGGIWKATGNYQHSVRLAARAGWFLGIGLILGGLALLLMSDQILNGLMLMFFGWALQSAAVFSGQRVAQFGALQNTRAKDIMTREFPPLSPYMNIGEIVRDNVVKTGQDYFAVIESGRLLGIVTARNINKVPKRRWDLTQVGKVMTAAEKVKTVDGEKPAAHILEYMDQLRVGRMPVLENGEIIGIVTRESLNRLAMIREALKI